jgi:hypothetical protein
MIIEPEKEDIDLNNNKIEEEPELEGDWESLGDELLYRKNKFEFEEKEIKHIKKMLSQSPPQLQYRRRVKNHFLLFIIIILFFY